MAYISAGAQPAPKKNPKKNPTMPAEKKFIEVPAARPFATMARRFSKGTPAAVKAFERNIRRGRAEMRNPFPDAHSASRDAELVRWRGSVLHLLNQFERVAEGADDHVRAALSEALAQRLLVSGAAPQANYDAI